MMKPNNLFGRLAGSLPGLLLLCLLASNGRAQTFTTLHSFTATSGSEGFNGTNSDGDFVFLGLLLSGNTLYGAAQAGGSSGCGTLFAVNTDGTGFTNLHNFTATSGTNGIYASYGYGTNRDGAVPNGGFILSGNTLYGTAQAGGSSGCGTLFAVNPDGTGFTNLHTFSATTGSAGGEGINSDGVNPVGGLILSGSTLYGTAVQGGTAGYGTVFALNTDGTGFRTLHSFTDGSDGGYPWDALILSGNTLYGTAAVGGSSSGNGIVFAVNTNGTGFTILHAFAVPPNQEGYPAPELVLSGTTLFGASFADGAYGHGTVFSLSYPSPRLTITPSGTNVNLTWPSTVAGFSYSAYTLQSTTNLAPPTVWATNSPAPVVVNGQNGVTNASSGAQQFFRLSQ